MKERKMLLQKLHNGMVTKNDLERLLDLILESPQENDDEIMKELWDQLDNYVEIEEMQSANIMDSTRRLINQEEESKILSQLVIKCKSLTLGGRGFWLRGTAAAILLLVIGSFSFYVYIEQSVITVRAGYGEQVEIILPDHSIVRLNSNSSLSFRKKWDRNDSRQVRLEGEAYFVVTKNPSVKQKFEVITKDLKVQVLGTVFNVNAREKMTTVFLEEGKVTLDLEDNDEDLGMKPGDIISYSRETRLPERKQIVEEVPASWRNGTMEFTDSSLKDILQRLIDIYGIEIDYNSKSALERRYRISIPIESLEIAFEVLKEVTRLDLTLKDKKIIVY